MNHAASNLLGPSRSVLFLLGALLALGCDAGKDSNDQAQRKTSKTDRATALSAIASKTPVPDSTEQKLGQRVYSDYCAECHGDSGDGYGKWTDVTINRPRSFLTGRFKFTTTTNGIASEQDIFDTIKRGMPGGGMPNWPQLSDEEITAVARTILRLGTQEIWREMEADVAVGRATREEAEKFFAERTVAGPKVSIPPEPPVTPAGIDRGREIYRAACQLCHGEEGRPIPGILKEDFEGNRVPPTSLAAGVFKGGSAGDRLFLRVLRGVNGTAMPSYEGVFSEEDLWHLVHYVQTLSKGGIGNSP